MPVPKDPKLFHLMIMEVKEYAIFTMDPGGRIVGWNKGAELMKGWAEEEILGQHLRTLYIAEEKELAAEHLDEAARVGHWEGEGLRLRKNGSHFQAHLMLTAVRHGEHLYGFVKITRDITQEKDLERRFREAHSLNATVTQTAADGLLMMDVNGRATFVNPAAEKILGWPREELLGKVLHEAVHYKHSEGSPFPMAEWPLGEVLRSGKTVRNREDTWVRRDGSVVPVLVSCAPILFEDRVTGAVLALHDITERRRAEEEARHHAEQLAEADRRKDEFLAMLAHELRNPLAPIVSGIELIEMTRPTQPAVQKALDRMSRQANTVMRLVDDLLDVSRITSGKIYLQKEEVSLLRVAEQAIDSVQHHVKKREQTLHLDVPGHLSFRADPARLQQIIANLLNNAAKYGRQKGNIWLKCYKDGDDPVIVVRDDGHGIRTEMLDKVFDIFVQEKPSPETGGLGIGLTLVRSLVQLHGGRVVARSDGPGKGAEFEVRLPMAPAASAQQPAKDGNGNGGRLRVLIVDDNVDQADNLAALLEMDGYQAEATYQGEEGIKRIGQWRPDVVLLDIGMPGLNGYEVISRLPPGSRPYMVAVTGYGQPSDRGRTREAGFDEHLVKPVRLEKLHEVLGRIRSKD